MMSILRSFLIESLTLLLSFVFLISEIFNYDTIAVISKAFVFPCLAYLYVSKAKVKNIYLTGFIFAFALSEPVDLLSLTSYEFDFDINYFVGNSLYILGYISLTLFVLRQIKINRVIKKLPFQLIILLAFSVYVFVALNNILPFEQGEPLFWVVYPLESLYNLLLVLLFSLSFLNYLENDTKPKLLLFMACAVLVFSEIIIVGYMYINQEHMLDVLQSVLYAIGFYLIYRYFVMNMQVDQIAKDIEGSKY